MLIYNSNEIDFENNGLGFLQDFTTNPQILEQLNGELSLSFEYSLNGLNSEYLIEENIIKAKYDNSYQLFRIKRKVKTLKRISIYATHIFYDLANNFIEDVRPTNKTCANALNDILTNTQYSHNFTGFSDIPTTNTAYYIRKNPVEAIISVDNSLINNWDGELERDNYLIKILARRGTDKGVKIAYGKNLKQFEETVDMTNLATRIMPVGANGLLLPEKYIDSPLINNYPMTFIKTITFDDIAVSEELTQEQAYELLRNRVNELYENGIDKPLVNIKIDWQDLSRTEEYFNKYNVFETVRLGDTVTVEVKGIELQTRVIKVVYDCLLEKYINFELGNFQPSFFNNQIQVIKEQIQLNNSNLLQQAKDNATEQITSALGGYIYKTQSELFIMDTNDPSTATKVWRWNLNGLGYSSEGINGPYELAMTQDGQIVADFITTGEMAVERITGLAGELSSIDLGITNITNTVTEQATLLEEEQIKTTVLEQTVDGLNLAIKRVGGNNLTKNSVMKNGTKFWLDSLQATYIESDTPPKNPIEGLYWYCSSNYETYVLGTIYLYANSEWVETSLTRKDLDNNNHLLQYTSAREDDESRKYTLSNSIIKLDGGNNLDVSHIFDVGDGVDIVEGEEYLTMSLKIKNSMKTGVGYIVLGFLNKYLEEIRNELVESIYEPSFLFTPDECKEWTNVVITAKIPKMSDIKPVVVSDIPPVDTTKLWLNTSYNLVMEYVDDNWTIRQSDKSVYDETTKIIYTYRGMFGGYYATSIEFNDNLEVKMAYPIITMYPSFYLEPSDTAPVPARNKYWLKTNDNAYRSKYDKDGNFIEWEDTGITTQHVLTNPYPVPPFPTEYGVPLMGYYEFADLKTEFNDTATAWCPHSSEIYGKNFKVDEKGLEISAGQNTMFIDEDEIVAKFNDQPIFQISGDMTWFKKMVLIEKMKIGNFVQETRLINGTEYFLLY